MAILITGGAGFIGLALAEHFLAAGRPVLLFDLAAPPADVMARPELTGARCMIGDVRRGSDIDAALATMPIELVVHAAAVTPNEQRERSDARGIIDVNIGGTVNLMERAVARGGIRRIVVVSSVAVYGFSPPAPSGFFEEGTSHPAPAALYGISKLAAEQAALRIAHLHNCDARIVRLGPVYGRWELPTSVRDALSPHHQVLQALQNGKEAILPRPMRADWIYSRDAAAGIEAVAMAAALDHAIYHVGGGTLSDLPDWCRTLASRYPDFRWRCAEPGEAPSIVYNLPADRAPLSIARLVRDTGFDPAYPVSVAAADYLAWAKIDCPASGGVS
ncbi:NAD(P)-dependent oxidoreductase [Bradyrhizobium sp. BR 10289]|uniref:NAD-dependent epimerase/dehydratase family protein n=1 Tax=Bradyrhizobium sp. BR 10289 TaxID=2749993 RepID=UPI001C649C7F|nr:NAD(P)-dependent oxidoreductase [Bradyrhizobium sp. BR 10289]MBW7973721.1 NAD(P)-dependent oxidoreductase [Bradyrhizobium sp. BR 10289]